jgi:hypothetical protein
MDYMFDKEVKNIQWKEAHWSCKLYMPQYRRMPGPRSGSGGQESMWGTFWDSIGNVNKINT